MGLAKRIIPTLLADGEKLVKGKQFNPWRTVGVVEQAARICGSRGVDEIILLDVTATKQGREPNYDLVRRISEAVFTPLTVGGGVSSLEHVKRLLQNGADKVAVGSAAWLTNIVREVADTVGNQAIVVACDVVVHQDDVIGARCMREVSAERAEWIASRGAGEILLTSVDREGTMQGYDLDLVRAVSAAVSVPVIAHGGCSGPDDMIAAIKAGASAVAAGALFQFTDWTPLACAEYLARNGIETRIPA